MFSTRETSFAASSSAAPDAFQPGRMVEVIGTARSTLALHHCLKTIAMGRVAAWITSDRGFSPVVALEALQSLPRLLTVQVTDGKSVLRATDLLLGCEGAAAIVVLDLPAGAHPTMPQLIRLQRRAERSATLLMVLLERSPSAHGSTVAVSLRLSTERHVTPDGETTVRVRAVQHKWSAQPSDTEVRDGPDRLRFHRSF